MITKKARKVRGKLCLLQAELRRDSVTETTRQLLNPLPWREGTKGRGKRSVIDSTILYSPPPSPSPVKGEGIFKVIGQPFSWGFWSWTRYKHLL